MSECCRTCKNWTNWKKSHEAISDALSPTPSWNVKTAILGRCILTNKMMRGDAIACEQYSPQAIEMKAVAR